MDFIYEPKKEHLLDSHLDSPYGLIAGLILGSIGAAKCLRIFVKRYLKNDEPTNNKRNK